MRRLWGYFNIEEGGSFPFLNAHHNIEDGGILQNVNSYITRLDPFQFF